MSEENWNIEPYRSFGRLQFGALRSQVAALIGPADDFDVDPEMGTLTEYRRENGLQTVFESVSGPLVMVSAYSNVLGIVLAGQTINWSETRELFRKLVESDTRARETVGITILFSLGVALSGFLSRDLGDKSITAFALGQWDENDPALRRIRQF